MPANLIRSAEDEKHWQQAKAAAEQAGKSGDYAYVTGVFERMKHKLGGKKGRRPWAKVTAGDTMAKSYAISPSGRIVLKPTLRGLMAGLVAKAREVLRPGSKGGKFYRTKKGGKTRYGEQPSGDLFQPKQTAADGHEHDIEPQGYGAHGRCKHCGDHFAAEPEKTQPDGRKVWRKIGSHGDRVVPLGSSAATPSGRPAAVAQFDKPGGGDDDKEKARIAKQVEQGKQWDENVEKRGDGMKGPGGRLQGGAGWSDRDKREAETREGMRLSPGRGGELRREHEAKQPGTPEGHKRKIAADTLKMPDAMAGVMGGPSKKQARETMSADDHEKRIGETIDQAKAKGGKIGKRAYRQMGADRQSSLKKRDYAGQLQRGVDRFNQKSADEREATRSAPKKSDSGSYSVQVDKEGGGGSTEVHRTDDLDEAHAKAKEHGGKVYHARGGHAGEQVESDDDREHPQSFAKAVRIGRYVIDGRGRIMAKAREVKAPGSKGGKFYRTKKSGKTRYGVQPSGPLDMPWGVTSKYEKDEHGMPRRVGGSINRGRAIYERQNAGQSWGDLSPLQMDKWNDLHDAAPDREQLEARNQELEAARDRRFAEERRQAAEGRRQLRGGYHAVASRIEQAHNATAAGRQASQDDYEADRDAGLLDDDYNKPHGDFPEPGQCPTCGGPSTELGKMGKRTHYRCRNCGMDHSQ